jgi:hypothetical protein
MKRFDGLERVSAGGAPDPGQGLGRGIQVDPVTSSQILWKTFAWSTNFTDR